MSATGVASIVGWLCGVAFMGFGWWLSDRERTVADEIARDVPWPMCPWCKTRHKTGCTYGTDETLEELIAEVEGISAGMARDVATRIRSKGWPAL